MKRLLLFFLLFIFMIVPALAQPPFQVSEPGTLMLEFPKFEYLKAEPFEFHLHVYNSSGALLNATDADCFLHIYNSSGQHIFTEQMTGSSNGVEFKTDLNSTVMSIGQKSYVAWCNTTDLGGFVSGAFEVTWDGEFKSTNPVILGFLIMIPLLAGFLILKWGISLDPEEHGGFKILLGLLSTAMVFVSLHFGLVSLIKFHYFPEMQEVIGSTTYWMTWVFVVFIIYWLIYIIVKAFESAKKKKMERLNY